MQWVLANQEITRQIWWVYGLYEAGLIIFLGVLIRRFVRKPKDRTWVGVLFLAFLAIAAILAFSLYIAFFG